MLKESFAYSAGYGAYSYVRYLSARLSSSRFRYPVIKIGHPVHLIIEISARCECVCVCLACLCEQVVRYEGGNVLDALLLLLIFILLQLSTLRPSPAHLTGVTVFLI